MKNTTDPKLGPCSICGATRSQRGPLFGDYSRIACYPNANGRDRCREREMARAFGRWVNGILVIPE